MSGTVVPFQPRQDVRLSRRRLARKPLAPVVTIRLNADALHAIATQIDEQEPERAERMYRAALMSEPGHVLCMVNLGVVLFRMRRWTEARDLFEQAACLDPQNPEAAYNLGYYYLDVRGDARMALNRFTASSELDPAHADSWFNRAQAHYQLGDRAAARACYRRYLHLDSAGDWADSARAWILRIDRELATGAPLRLQGGR